MTFLQQANPHLIGKQFTGYALEVEQMCAQAFNRPPATFYLDIPYHPQIQPTPTVNFALNYHF